MKEILQAAANSDRSESAKQQSAPRELTEIIIDQNLPLPLRAQRFIDSVCDPYRFTVNGTEVRIRFSVNGINSINIQLACALIVLAGSKKESHYTVDTFNDFTDPTENTVA